MCVCADIVMLLLNVMWPWNRSCDGWKRRTSDRAFNPNPSEVQEEEERGKWLPVADITARVPPGINSPVEGDLTRGRLLKIAQGLERGCKQLWSAETFVWKGAAADDALSKFLLLSHAGGLA